MEKDNPDDATGHPFHFPFEPYPVQVQLMQAIYDAAERGKIGIMESPTGTGKSLSTICAALSWLEMQEKRRQHELEEGIAELSVTIEETAKERDWLNVHKRRMEAEQRLEELREEQANRRRIEEKLERARNGQKKFATGGGKTRVRRHISGGSDKEEEEEKLTEMDGSKNSDEDNDLIPNEGGGEEDDEFEMAKEAKGEEVEEDIQLCPKLIYASRTHSQLEQFAKELEKTQFRPRILTLGSRQILCINDGVRELGQAGLINDRCNELLSGETTIKGGQGKRAKMEDSQTITKKTAKKCGCEFARSSAIEDLSDAILAANDEAQPEVQSIPNVLDLGRQRRACPYFASKSALRLSQLILVPYNILLHKGTRQTWNLSLKGNIVLIDEAHNLLQTLASIHSVELSHAQLDACCQCLHDYLDRFRTRLTATNLRNVRQLHTLALALQRLLSSFANSESEKSTVLTLPQFMIKLGDSMNIDFIRLLAYLEKSKLCKKLRDFRLRYHTSTTMTPSTKENKAPAKFDNNKIGEKQATKEQKIVPPNYQSSMGVSATPLYKLREFIEAITTRAEDARIVVERGNDDKSARLRFILLNPAEKLREMVAECRSLILLGGTMRPTDHLMDAFTRVCGVPGERICEFSCGHVVAPEQLVTISIEKGPDQAQLNLQFANRDSAVVLRSLAQTIVNLIRHIPNGSVAFFPSYAFLGSFVQSIRASGHLVQLEKLKAVFVEARAGQEEDIWPPFCQAARTQNGALLMAVVGGKLSEGINFSDELGRCVFMVGLPYPNRHSVELQERMKFVDDKIGPGAGNRLYDQLCLQSLNQAIGRAIRHRHDYAAILLLDQRFTRPSLVEGLPGWIRQRLRHARTFPEALSALIHFYRSHRRTDPLKNS